MASPTNTLCTSVRKPNSGNGGQGPNYYWTQTLSELIVTFPIRGTITPKQISCNFTATTIHLSLSTGITILSGNFYTEILPLDSVWQFDCSDNTIVLYIEKQDSINWWPCFIQGHDRIDLSCIEPGSSRVDEVHTQGKTVDITQAPSIKKQSCLPMVVRCPYESSDVDNSNPELQVERD